MKKDNLNHNNNNDDLDLGHLVYLVWSKKKLVFKITSVFALLAIMIALIIPNVYTSSALLAPIKKDDSLASQLGGYSSISGLAGVNLNMEIGSMSQEAVERMQSFEFFSKHFLPYIKKQNLIAVKEWLPKENKIIYREKLYDEENDQWVRKVNFPKTVIPSDQELFLRYYSILRISEDAQTSFITVSIRHQSPHIAKEWLDLVIENINESMRENDKEIAKKSIEFLNNSSKTTSVQSLKDAISRLLESQMKTLMLTSSNKAYVFKILDSPIVSEEKSGPSRLLILIFGIFFGLIVSVSIVFFQNFRKFKIS